MDVTVKGQHRCGISFGKITRHLAIEIKKVLVSSLPGRGGGFTKHPEGTDLYHIYG